MSTYRGFSTISSSSQKKFVLTDKELIKQDLLNAFQTKRGSRVMQPNIGCIVWEKLFETLSETDVQDIGNNIGTIVNSDPRVTMISCDVSQNIPSVTVTVLLQYTATNETDQLIVNFDSAAETTGSF